jgi:hypothetical protein
VVELREDPDLALEALDPFGVGQVDQSLHGELAAVGHAKAPEDLAEPALSDQGALAIRVVDRHPVVAPPRAGGNRRCARPVGGGADRFPDRENIGRNQPVKLDYRW